MTLSGSPANQNLLRQTRRLRVQDSSLKLSVIRPGLHQGLNLQFHATDFIDVVDRDGLRQLVLYRPNAVISFQRGKYQKLSKGETLWQQDGQNSSTQPWPNRRGQVGGFQEMGECGCGHKRG